jgi:hypothetical protein
MYPMSGRITVTKPSMGSDLTRRDIKPIATQQRFGDAASRWPVLQPDLRPNLAACDEPLPLAPPFADHYRGQLAVLEEPNRSGSKTRTEDARKLTNRFGGHRHLVQASPVHLCW